MFKKAKYYRDCSELKMDKFNKILKSWDKDKLCHTRLDVLCYEGKPKQKELKEIWAKIEQEYELKASTPQHFSHLNQSNEDCKEIIRNNGLILLYWKKKLAPQKDWSEDEIFWEVEGYDANGIFNVIMRERTEYNIRKLQEYDISKMKEKTDKPITMERLKIIVTRALDLKFIDFETIFVDEWIEMVKMLQEMTEEK